jgi:hypothetical protein
MGESSERPAEAVQLVLDFGESVEVDGSTVLDPVAEAVVPAVVLRMPRARAAWFGRVLDAYTRVCRLAGVEVDAAEAGPAWALSHAAMLAGHVEPDARPGGSGYEWASDAGSGGPSGGGGLRRYDADSGGRCVSAVAGGAGG